MKSEPVFSLRRIKDAFQVSENTYLLILAFIIGILTGLAAVVFRGLVETINIYFFSQQSGALGNTPVAQKSLIVLLPALGGLIVGYFVYRVLKEEGGHGVPAVMKAVALGRIILRPRMALKSLSAVITIASGGSAGPEGPLVEMGSVVGSTVGQYAKISKDKLGILVGCGAAGGISAVFGAPIGGVFFALEIILRDFTLTTFSPVVLASVVASVVSRALLRPDEMAIVPPNFVFGGASELIFYGFLGLLCGGLAALFISVMYRAQDFFSGINLPIWLKPAIGGLAVGLVGLLFPQVLGEGYYSLNRMLNGEFAYKLVLALLFLKIFATSLTLGSGGTGGSFAPAVFVGAAAGWAFAHIVNLTFPDIFLDPASFAMVGMAGLVSGFLGAPITATLIIFEVTRGDYQVMLPLMVAVSISALLTHRLQHASVYTLTLLRTGFSLDRAHHSDPLAKISVGELMHSYDTALREQLTLTQIIEIVSNSRQSSFPLLSEQGELKGLVTLQDLRAVLAISELGTALIAQDIADPNPPTVHLNDTISAAVSIFSHTDIDEIPVVDKPNSRKIVGLISRQDVLAAYRKYSCAQT